MPYNSSTSRRARRKRRRRNRQLFMSCILFSIILTMIITFVFGKEAIFNRESNNSYSQNLEQPVISSHTDTASSSEPKEPEKAFTICIDPGHGFDDPGATSTIYDDLYESNVNLDVALLLRDILENRGFKVIMTHDTNTKPADAPSFYRVSLEDRSSLANSNDVDLFISLHCNSYEDDETVSGIRLYYYEYSSDETKQYASMISNGISGTLNKSCSVNTQNLHVCREVNMPSVLVEMGFITNKSDCQSFKDQTWQKNMALGVADGISDYYETFGV